MHILLLWSLTVRIAISVCNLIMVLLYSGIQKLHLLFIHNILTPLEYMRLWVSWLLYSISQQLCHLSQPLDVVWARPVCKCGPDVLIGLGCGLGLSNFI